MALPAPGRRHRGPRRSALEVVEALATPHGLDRYLELVHPMLTVRELRAEVTGVRRTPHAVTLTLRPTRAWRGFAPGQFVQVTVDVDGVRRTRCYSPAGSAHREDRIELTVRAHPDGLVSRYLYANARPGLVVGLTPADGTFRLPQPRPACVVLISGGSGITPVLAMLRTLLDEGYAGEIAFVHYARTPEHNPYAAELAELATAHPNLTLSTGYRAADGGEITGDFAGAHLPSWHVDAPAFVCGPAPLMDAVRAHYAALGRGEQVQTEAFTPAAPAAVDGPATGAVRFGATVVDNSGATLLEQAEAAGLTPEFGCRMGICFTCTKIKTSGCTRNVRTGELDRDPDTEVQLCINVPVGDVAIDA